MSDEIGHFENCLQLDATNVNCAKPGTRTRAGSTRTTATASASPATDSTLVKINGCFSDDGDWDGQSYRNDWPGTIPNPRQDRKLHPSPVLFTSPLANGTTNYSTIAFETDLPRIEAADSQDNPPFCDRTTGANCVNPPNGAQFYPFFTTGDARTARARGSRAATSSPAPSTTSAAARPPSSGRCCRPSIRTPGFTTVRCFNNFNSGDMTNPCPATP